MAIQNWNSNPASNDSAPPYGAPEGATPVSSLNDIDRQIMADVRVWYENPTLRVMGDNPTYASANSFTVDDASNYHVGQALWIQSGAAIFTTVTAINGSTITIKDTITDPIASLGVGLPYVPQINTKNTFSQGQTVSFDGANVNVHGIDNGGEVVFNLGDGAVKGRIVYNPLVNYIAIENYVSGDKMLMADGGGIDIQTSSLTWNGQTIATV